MSINGTIGNLALYGNELVLLGKSVCYINPSPELDSEYLYNFLSADSTQDYFRRELTGTTINNLSLRTIRSTQIPIHSLNDQHNISLTMNSLRSILLNKERQLLKTRELKSALSSDLLSGRKRVSV